MTSDLKRKVEYYLNKAEPMFKGLRVSDCKVDDWEAVKKHFYEMALSYYEDAKHFYENEDYVNALAALEYAEGWLDAGECLGIFRKKIRDNLMR